MHAGLLWIRGACFFPSLHHGPERAADRGMRWPERWPWLGLGISCASRGGLRHQIQDCPGAVKGRPAT